MELADAFTLRSTTRPSNGGAGSRLEYQSCRGRRLRPDLPAGIDGHLGIRREPQGLVTRLPTRRLPSPPPNDPLTAF